VARHTRTIRGFGSSCSLLQVAGQWAITLVLLLTPLFSVAADEDWPPPRGSGLEQEELPASPDGSALLVSNIVISQVYGGGGNSGSTYTHDFVELFNRGSTTVSVNGWSVQYASSTGTGLFGASTTSITPLPNVSLAPGQYLLIQEAQGSGGTTALPTPDVTDSSPIALSGTGGKVALVSDSTGLGCNGGSTPCSAAQMARIVDLLGWGPTTNFYEGAGPAPATTNTTSSQRDNNGCTETDNNNTDFASAAPVPRNSATAAYYCSGPTNPSGVGAANPNALQAGGTTLLTMAVTPGGTPTSTGLAVNCDLSSIGQGHNQGLFDLGTSGDVTAGDLTFSWLTTVTTTATAGTYILPCTITDVQTRTATSSITLHVTPPPIYIHDVQGAAHISPYAGQTVLLQPAIVTAIRRTSASGNGFWIEHPVAMWDADSATSEGIWVYTGSTVPTVLPGDSVTVSGPVNEYRGASASLGLTQINVPVSIQVLSSGNPLPAFVQIGGAGRTLPATVIDDDATGDVESSGTFDPVTDGMDFYESLEGMLVFIDTATAVGPTNDFGSNREIPVVLVDATVRTPRGGIVVRATDFNPERIILNDWIKDGPTLPAVDVGDATGGVTSGVIDYSFSNFKLQVISPAPLTFTPGGLAQEVTQAAGPGELAIATFNVENLAATDPITKFDTLAGLIVNNLQAPDILAVEEIQDINGTTNNGIVDASTTWNLLIGAITTAGGPVYQYRQIDPLNNQDGGATGGNIRQGFLFRTDRGLVFVDRPGASATTANAVVGSGAGTRLAFSPGRIDPTSAAFTDSRKPLAGEFTYNGKTIFVVANHFNSKGGDDPLYGHWQPPVLYSEVQRMMQAQAVNDFVDSILVADPLAKVVVLGDLNDFQWSNPMTALKGTPAVLHNLMDTLPESERYSYVYEGNSQALDHILLSDELFSRNWYVHDVVHVNSEFAVQASDHDPQVVRLLQGLEIDKSHFPEPVTAGWNFWYYIDITNTSSAPALNVVVTDTLPVGVAAYSVQPGSGGVFDGVDTVVWTIPSIAPNTTIRLTIKARTYSTQAGNCLTNVVVADSDLATPPAEARDTICVVKGALAQPTPTPTPTATPTPPPGTTVIIQKAGPGNSEDTYVYRYQPMINYWLQPLLKVGYKQNYASLIRFDLSPIPAGAKVEEAWLEVYAAGWSGLGADITVGAYAVSGTVTISETTWISSQNGLEWALGGANDVLFDRRELPEHTLTTAGPTVWYRFDLTELTQEWLDGSTANNGALLRCESCYLRQVVVYRPEEGGVPEGADEDLPVAPNGIGGPVPGNLCPYTFFFASSENPDPTHWPRLVVRYQ